MLRYHHVTAFKRITSFRRPPLPSRPRSSRNDVSSMSFAPITSPLFKEWRLFYALHIHYVLAVQGMTSLLRPPLPSCHRIWKDHVFSTTSTTLLYPPLPSRSLISRDDALSKPSASATSMLSRELRQLNVQRNHYVLAVLVMTWCGRP